MPVPPEQTGATCPNCAAPIVADQRYCLSCGQALTPVRLAFLDVLQSESQASAVPRWPADGLPGGDAGAPPLERWLRRYSGLFGLLAVLLLAIVAGLLVGHWVTQGNKTTTGKQVVEVKGLPTISTAPATGAATTATATPTTTAASKSAAAEEAKEAREAKAEEKKAVAAPTKSAPASAIKKLEKTTGKQHQEEISKLGDQPIETGG